MSGPAFYADAAGEHRWHVKAPNGRILADSGEGYTSEAGAREGLADLLDELGVTALLDLLGPQTTSSPRAADVVARFEHLLAHHRR